MSVASTAGNTPAPPLDHDELGRFGRWWIDMFGRSKHSASLDEIERIAAQSGDMLERRLAFLVRRLSFTSGARFETARRHKKKNRTSIISIIILSMYAIFFSMMASYSAIGQQTKELLSMFSIFMSSFILAFALYEDSKRYDARSETFLRCATELQVLRDQAATRLSAGNVDLGFIEQMEARYHAILSGYTDNHSVLDYGAHQISLGKVVGPRLVTFKLLYLVNIWLMPIIAATAPIMLYGMYKIVGVYARLGP